MEDRRQLIIVAVVAMFFLGGILVAYVMSDSGGKGGLRADQRFKARPGTTRENAMVLMSNKRPAGVDKPSASTGGGSSNSTLDVRSFSSTPPSNPQDTTEDTQRTATNALAMANPAEGVAALESALQTQRAPQDQARLYATLAELHTRRDPPATDEAVACLKKAAELAPTPETRMDIAAQAATLLRGLGQTGMAEETVRDTLAAVPADAKSTAPELKLRVTLGDLLAARGDLAGAEQAYAQAVGRGLETLSADGPEALDALRIAGIRLSQLYRNQQRHEEAEAVAQRIQARLRRAMAPQ